MATQVTNKRTDGSDFTNTDYTKVKPFPKKRSLPNLNADLLQNVDMEEPGQYELVECVIQTKLMSVDVSIMVESFSIYESIFKTFVTGSITLLDRIDFLSETKLTGTEPVFIKFRTLGSKHTIDIELMVSKVKEMEKVNEISNRYVLSLISPEFIKDARSKVSRSLEGSYSDMVKTLYYDYLGASVPLWLEETRNNNRIIIPNKSPVDAINMIAQFCVSKMAFNVSFLFFQTTKSFQFRSMSEMIIADRLEPQELTITFDKEITDPEVPIHTKATNAIEFEVSSGIDILKHTSLGTYGSSLITHDIRSKTFSKTEFNYHSTFGDDAEFNDYIKIHDHPLTPNGPVTKNRSNLSSFPDSEVDMTSSASVYQYQTLQNVPEFEELDYESTILQRRSEISAMNIQRANLKIGGMSGIQAGDIINMHILTSNAAGGVGDKAKDVDNKLSGKWLIESVTHTASEKYYCDIVLIRDAVPEKQDPYTELNYALRPNNLIIASSGDNNR
jgi:hypothetical protein